MVDDDTVDRKLVIRTLNKSQLDAEIVEAKTVDQALSLYQERRFDVVLLDFSMPKRDGIEMLMELKRQANNLSTAIVMMSVSEDDELALKCIRAGAHDFLMKSEINETRLKRVLLQASARNQLEQQLYAVKQKAETDSLTQLPNRYFFDESLKQAIGRCQRNQQNLALILFDLDHFKDVNDNLGHDIGDELLKKVVTRFKSCLRDNEVLSRIGGDEFAIILTNMDASESAALVARRILAVLQKPVELASNTINITASIGIAVDDGNQNHSQDLFKFADIALYRAKNLGRNQLCFFESELQQRYQRKLRIETELEYAIDNKELRLYFQPIVCPHSQQTFGYEALLRWQRKDQLRLPADFLTIAEESHQIAQLDAWVLEQALLSLNSLIPEHEQTSWLSINLTHMELTDKSFVSTLTESLERHGIPPHRLRLEFNEQTLLKDTGIMFEVLTELHNYGTPLVLDDFGTGISSFNVVEKYPLTAVKIDTSLVPSNFDDKKQRRRFASIVAMLTRLELEVVVEGIETQQQVELCQRLGVDALQGYYFAMPAPAQHFNHQSNLDTEA